MLLVQIVLKFWKMIKVDNLYETARQTVERLIQVDKNDNIEEDFHDEKLLNRVAF